MKLFSPLLLAGVAAWLSLAVRAYAEPGGARVRRPEVHSPAENASSFRHILFDARASRGGNGDVSAAYITIVDLLNRLHYPGRTTLVADANTLKILGRLTGAPVNDGTWILGQRVQVLLAESLKGRVPPADLYVSLANPTGAFNSVESQGGYLPAPEAERLAGIPLDKNAVLIAQTVLGNTETATPQHAVAKARVGAADFDLQPAGLAPHESGIYFDPVASRLRKMSRPQIRHYLLEASARISDPPVRETVRGMVSGKLLRGAKFGMAYGLTNAPSQFYPYLRTLLAEAEATHSSFVIVTPSRFDVKGSEDEWSRNVEVLEPGVRPPAVAVPGKVYVVRSGAVPQEVFVGMMAFSEIPLVISGDGALSAAIQLGKPFWMTKVDWNYKNIENLKDRLTSTMPPGTDRAPLEAVLPPGRHYSSWTDGQVDASQALKLRDPEIAVAYANLSDNIPLLTDVLLEDARALQAFAGGKVETMTLVSQVRDPMLRQSLLLHLAARGDAAAFRATERLFQDHPREMAWVILRDQMPETLIQHERVRSILEGPWASRSDPVLVQASIRALAMIGDERAKTALVEKMVRYETDRGSYGRLGSLFEEEVGATVVRVLSGLDAGFTRDSLRIRSLLRNASHEQFESIVHGFLDLPGGREAKAGEALDLELAKIASGGTNAASRKTATWALYIRHPPATPELIENLVVAAHRFGDEGYILRSLGSVQTRDPRPILALLQLLADGRVNDFSDLSYALSQQNSGDSKILARLEELIRTGGKEAQDVCVGALASTALRGQEPALAIELAANILRQSERYPASTRKLLLERLSWRLPNEAAVPGIAGLLSEATARADEGERHAIESIARNLEETQTKGPAKCLRSVTRLLAH